MNIFIEPGQPWTTRQIEDILIANGLTERFRSLLTVRVQSEYASQTTTSVGTVQGGYSDFQAAMYLRLTAASANSTISHEFGHVWTLYHLYMTQKGIWTPYLQARGLSGESRLDTSYSWSKGEIIADDYRLLFGSQAAINERPRHLNPYIADPRMVSGLREFLARTWAGTTTPVPVPTPTPAPLPVWKTCPTCGGTGKVQA